MVAKHPVIIVDDEYLARDELRNIVMRRHPEFEIVGEAASALEAWNLVKEFPQIEGVFLDIHIQAENERAGLDLAYAINRLSNAPWIVFVTGHPQTAVEAHRLHPAHYLLKPLEEAGVKEALDWVRRRQVAPEVSVFRGVRRIAIRHRIVNRFDEHEWHTEFVDPEEIVLIAKNKSANTLRVHLLQDSVLDGVNGTIKDWAGRYGDLGFVQIHRSHLVNLKNLRSLKPRAGENDVYKVALKDSVFELAVGPEYLDELRGKLNKGLF